MVLETQKNHLAKYRHWTRGSAMAAGGQVTRREDEEASLDLVQRVVVSALLIAVFGALAAVLAAYVAGPQEDVSHGDAIGLWVMTGVVGVITAAAVLIVNRRPPYSPWVLLGFVPMAASAYGLFT